MRYLAQFTSWSFGVYRFLLFPLILINFGASLYSQELPALEPPLNDNVVAAKENFGTEFTLAADLGAATQEDFEGCCHQKTAWWKWTAPEGGIYTWSVAPGPNQFAVSVFRMDPFEQLIPIAVTHQRYNGAVFGSFMTLDQDGSFQAVAGVGYFIQVKRSPSEVAVERFAEEINAIFNPGTEPVPATSKMVSATFKKLDVAAPANDALEFSMRIPSAPAPFTADLSAATEELGEPRVSAGVLHRTLWWNWQAPGHGTAMIRSIGANGPPVVGIYSQNLHGALEIVASSGTVYGNRCYSYEGARNSVAWDTKPGQRFEIQVDRFPQMAVVEPAELEITFIPVPTNDVPAGAMRIDALDVSLVVSNTASTLRENEVRIPGQSGENSVWFRWRSPGRGVLQVSRFEPLRYDEPSHNSGGAIGIIITIVTPICSEPVVDLYPTPPFVPVFGLFTQNDAAPDNMPVYVTHATNTLMHEIHASEDFYIALDGDQRSSGETPFHLLFTPPPVNDQFTKRIVLPSEPVLVAGRTFAATFSSTDPRYDSGSGVLNRSVWWEWKAPAAGRWIFVVKRGNYEARFAVFRGETPSLESELAGTQNEAITFDCAAGEVFQIGVFALSGSGGNVQFGLAPVATPSLRFHSLIDDADRSVRSVNLQLPDNAGLTYIVEQSSDLTHWNPVWTNANASAHLIPLALPFEQLSQFFRARFP